MDGAIGNTLREARNRRKLDLSEVEAATKIRVRYLRALENEEWDTLPGDAYARGFIRTYAAFLGLDGDRLADEYRRSVAPGGGPRAQRIEPVPTARTGSRRRLPGRLWAAVVFLLLAALAIGIGLADGGGGGGPSQGAKEPAGAREGGGGGGEGKSEAEVTAPAASPGVGLRLEAKAEVWVCLLDADGEPLIEGQILEPGAAEGPFRSRSYTAAFGNGEVEMVVDGEPADVPPSSSPVGYEIGPDGEPTELEEGERPDCE